MNPYKLLTIITISLPLLILPVVIQAQEPADDADRELIKQKLKERLDETNGAMDASNAAILESESKYFAYYGLIEEATGSSMLIKTEQEVIKKISLAKDVEISQTTKSKTTKIKLEDIKPGKFAIAMGTMGVSKTLNATRLSISEPPKEVVKRLVLSGKVTEIDSNTISLANDQNVQIDLPKTYELQIQGVEDPELDDVSINDKAVAIVISEADADDLTKTIYTLKTIYVSPSINNPLAETNKIIEEAPNGSEATPSAE